MVKIVSSLEILFIFSSRKLLRNSILSFLVIVVLLIQGSFPYANGGLTSTIKNQNLTTMTYDSPGDTPDVRVKKTSGNNTLVERGNNTLYEGPDSATAIQIGINSLSPGQDIYLYNGTYSISRGLNFSDDIYVHGQGNNTILDYSAIGINDALKMGKSSHLANVKVSGSIDPIPRDFTQRLRSNENTILENVSISKMAYGIDVSGDNITLINIRCEFIQSEEDWGACIHGGSGTKNLIVRQFTIADSNRGIELDANSTNVVIQNGSIYRVRNFNGTGHDAYSIDSHSHVGDPKNSNIYYDSIYIEDSNGPSAMVAESFTNDPRNKSNYYALGELPTDISYQNITVVNPKSAWVIGGDGVTVKNSKIINATGNAMSFYKNSKNIWIENVTSNDTFDTQKYDPIKNLTLINNTIISDLEIDPFVTLKQIASLQESMLDYPMNNLASTRAITNLNVCNNHINYYNETLCSKNMVEQYKRFGFLIPGTNLTKSSIMDLEYLETLGYDNNSFALNTEKNNNAKLWQIGNENSTDTATLFSKNHGHELTLWSSKPIQQPEEGRINYIESKFRVLDSRNGTKESHAGIVWNDGQKVWYTPLRSHNLSVYNSVDNEIAINSDTSRHKGVWYTLKILFLQNSTDVYLDDFLKFQIPRALSDNFGLSSIGIRSANIDAEFKPIKIGRAEVLTT